MSEQITVCIADNDEDYRRWLERELGSAGEYSGACSFQTFPFREIAASLPPPGS